MQTFGITKAADYNEEGITGWALEGKNISANGGNLVLDAGPAADRTYTENGHTYTGKYYMGSEARTTQYYTYGYYEARMRINASIGICPAFWLLGKEDPYADTSTFYEIDIFECFGKNYDLLKATPLKHVVTYSAFTGDATTTSSVLYVKSVNDNSLGKYVPVYRYSGDYIYEDATNTAVKAKDGLYYALAGTQFYTRKQSTFNAYNTNQFSSNNWEVLCPERNPDATSEAGEATYSYFEGFTADGEFHTYALKWTEDYIMWIYDDIPVIKYNFCDVDESIGNKFEFKCNSEMNIIFTCYSGNDVHSPHTGLPVECDCEGDTCTAGPSVHTDWENGSSLEVDYVVVYQ